MFDSITYSISKSWQMNLRISLGKSSSLRWQYLTQNILGVRESHNILQTNNRCCTCTVRVSTYLEVLRFSETYTTPMPRIKKMDIFICIVICTCHSIGIGNKANSQSKKISMAENAYPKLAITSALTQVPVP